MDEQPLRPPGDPAPEPLSPTEPPPPSGWIQPPPGQKPSRVLPAILAVVAFGVVGVLGLLVFIGANVDPRDAAASDFGRRLMEMPEFEARYGDVDSAEEAYRLGQQVGLTAFARLDDTSLLQRHEVVREITRPVPLVRMRRVVPLRPTNHVTGAREPRHQRPLGRP